ncbi:unnamed protein product [Knipowitschia caucasica]
MNKMAHTFAYRRQEVVNTEPIIRDFKDRWSALFSPLEINAEFQRLIALPLEAKLFAQLDKHSTALLALARLKGGEMREKLAPIMHTYDQAEDIRMKRTSILKALITVPGEQPHSV